MNMKIVSLSVLLLVACLGNTSKAFDKKEFYQAKRNEITEKENKALKLRSGAMRDHADAKNRVKTAKEKLGLAEKILETAEKRFIESEQFILSNNESIYVSCMKGHLKALAAGNKIWLEGPMQCGDETCSGYQECYQAYQARKRAENDAILLQEEAEKLSRSSQKVE